MKRKNASLLGNVLMGLGLVVMVVGVLRLLYTVRDKNSARRPVIAL